MEWQETIRFFSLCLPRQVVRTLMNQPEGSVREIRIRAGGHATLCTAQGDVVCPGALTPAQVAQIAEALSEHALYARAEEQRQGFIALRGGHRMGLCGRVIAHGQTVRAFREVSSLCVRIAGQWYGAAEKLYPHLKDQNGCPRSVLIVGMPGSGKTTLLRDGCRWLSEQGHHMCVVDERSEIAAVSGSVAQLDVGPNTDVLDGCSKGAGLRWMLRAMSPDVLVTDELGSAMDVQAVLEAGRSGVAVMATLHGRDMEHALSRGALYQLVQNRAFDRYVLLAPKQTAEISLICDEQLHPLDACQEAV